MDRAWLELVTPGNVGKPEPCDKGADVIGEYESVGKGDIKDSDCADVVTARSIVELYADDDKGVSSPLSPVGTIEGKDTDGDDVRFPGNSTLVSTSMVVSAGGVARPVVRTSGGSVWISMIEPVASITSTIETVSTMTTMSELSPCCGFLFPL